MHEKVDWIRVMEFIAAKDPTIAASCVGVEPSQIAAAEEQHRVVLPSEYSAFLERMGENAGGLRLFGGAYGHRFSKLLGQPQSTDYPTDRFFKVAYESDPMSVSNEDLYLDLRRSDGQEAPLVRFEIPLSPEDEIEDEPLSLSERVVSQVFWILEVSRTKYTGTVMVFGEDASWNGQMTKTYASTLLANFGFSTGLPDLPRITCVTRGPVSALVEVSDELELVGIRLGGDTLESVEAVAEELLKELPGAEIRNPPRLRSELRS